MSGPGHRVEVVDYDPAWPEMFAREAHALATTLRPWLTGPLEHVGSTAVPNLCAKPVIDMMAPVDDLESSRSALEPLEARHGYTYWPYKADVMHWLCKPSEFVRTHHLHLVPAASSLFRDRLRFRDMLRRDPDLAARYGELKRGLALRHPHDREQYTDAKTPFIDEVLARGAG